MRSRRQAQAQGLAEEVTLLPGPVWVADSDAEQVCVLGGKVMSGTTYESMHGITCGPGVRLKLRALQKRRLHPCVCGLSVCSSNAVP